MAKIQHILAGLKYMTSLNLIFFQGFYETYSGKTLSGAACHFEATGARWAFPCWDEPSFRATFSIKICAQKQFTILSNMPEVHREQVDGGLEAVHFDKVGLEMIYKVSQATYLV